MSDSESEYDISSALAGGYSSDEEGSSQITSTKIENHTTDHDENDENDDDEAEFFNSLGLSHTLTKPSAALSGNGSKKTKSAGGGAFGNLGLTQATLKAVYKKGFKTPTPIQRKTIPLVLEGLDVVGMARTGSGKTAAFVLPMIEKLKVHSAKVGARAVIMSPSRELALQTLKVVKDFSRGTDLKSVLLVGGDSLEDQFGSMMANPDIIIATPGRFLHLKVEMDLDLSSIEYIVFDEADRLFEMGFAMQLSSIMASLPASRQSLLFSATLPKSLVEFAKAGLHDPVLVRLDSETKISTNLELFFYSVKTQELDGALTWILRHVIKMPTKSELNIDEADVQLDLSSDDDDDVDSEYRPTDSKTKQKLRRKEGLKKKRFINHVPKGNELLSPHSTIVFTPTRHHVEYVAFMLRSLGYAVSYIYGSLDQRARKEQLAHFRAGMTTILVVTDVAARGIDIPILSNVVNYSFPGSPKIFVHRVGRTARAGRTGKAFSLVKETELPYLLDLELFLGKKMILPRFALQNVETFGSEDLETSHGALNYSENMYIGSLPRDVLENSCEEVAAVLDRDHELVSMRAVAQKGEKLYLKSRGAASKESVRRAKEVQMAGWDELAPMFVESKGTSRDSMLARLSRFRPSETVFEIGRRGGQSTSAEIMKRRREQIAPIKQHAKENRDYLATKELTTSSKKRKLADIASDSEGIDGPQNNEGRDAVNMDSASEDEISSTFTTAEDRRKRRSLEKATKYTRSTSQDSAHYISHYEAAAAAEDRGYSMNSFADAARGATFDLVNDDTGDQRGSGMKWDKRKGKYIYEHSNGVVDFSSSIADSANSSLKANSKGGKQKKKGAMIRGENGIKIPATFKSGRFDSWKSANKTRGIRVGEMEKDTASFGTASSNTRYKHKSVQAPKVADKLRDDYKSRQKRVRSAVDSGLHVKGYGASRKGGVRGELRNSEQMQKNRTVKQQRREKNARPSRKKR
ncbi:P-loop containing nucleoside triphosphate hydrolase protein [Dipodascopsis tothii]|uniref:P-loop containing nucleoside triphosphate hydrolase protein n=1 Tax=Dipodascopsis tothii TaxID=44089 RepID=UPI0034CFC4C9